MAAQPASKLTSLETEVDDFEDVALLLEPDQEQPIDRKRSSWKGRILEYFARDPARNHIGFEKLGQSDNLHEASGRTKGRNLDTMFACRQIDIHA